MKCLGIKGSWHPFFKDMMLATLYFMKNEMVAVCVVDGMESLYSPYDYFMLSQEENIEQNKIIDVDNPPQISSRLQEYTQNVARIVERCGHL